MPEVKPVAGEPVGILPQLIFFLVDRRRNVKRMMKDASITPAKYLQYNITQQALKLTANSMYGCLGFETGRFCARPLAALTTHKGREILIQTKADAENASLKVSPSLRLLFAEFAPDSLLIHIVFSGHLRRH